jgi:tripartite ATP-independent transporter DctP family solute receptor
MIMMRRLLKGIGIFVTVSLIWAGFCGLSYASSPEITLRYAGDLPIGNWLTRAQEFFAKRVETLSKGRAKIEVYPAGQLFSAKDYPTAVPGGAIDMAQCALAQWSGLVPLITTLDLPLFYDGLPHVWRVLDAEPGEVLNKDFEKVGVKNLFWMQDTSLGFASKVPLRKLEDWRGKRIRAYSELTSHTIKALGAAPAFLGGGEVYMALQRGTVEGAITGVNAMYDRRYSEVTKYVVEPGFSFAVYGALINLKKWNELPKDIQEILLAAGKETQEWGRKEVQKVETELLEELKKQGMEIYFLPKEEKARWRAACKPAYDVVSGKTGERGRKILEFADKVR